ncbi:hypothetical protein [Limnochorda pilosa]|uniref:hypothetical protein n=1 Tax=Limnochorda pilosa TaxID=1555112 RepID=UPI0011877024|nr:hypothetical protein [Limnochorda pilosa]
MYPFRRTFVASSEERRAARKNRRRKITKLCEAIDKVQRNLGLRTLTTPEAVKDRMKGLLATAKLEDAFDWSVEGQGRAMRLQFTKNEAALRRLQQLDGVYTLVTNLGPEYTNEQFLERYKRQYLSERRFADLKGPLQVRPVFWKRTGASLRWPLCSTPPSCSTAPGAGGQEEPDGDGYHPDGPLHPQAAQAARRLMLAFEFYAVQRRQLAGDVEYLVPRPTPLQQQIFETLGIDRPLHFLDTSSPEPQ